MDTTKVPEPADTPRPSFFVPIPEPFAHQRYTTQFYVDHPRVLDFSDPGTGKTRAAIDAIVRLQANGAGKALILAPKAILEPSWAKDLQRFAPQLRYVVATAAKRAKAFTFDVDVYITNHDATSWLAERQYLLDQFDILVLDESTAFKHRESQRSKAALKIAKRFKHRAALTGTPISNDVLNIWHQALLIDDGAALGSSYFAFRAAVCEPRQVGPHPDMLDWFEKPGARDAIADALSSITVRHRFEDCVDIPERTERVLTFILSPAHRKAYDTLLRFSLLELEGKGQIDAVHAAALTTKLQQVAAGSVYDTNKNPTLITSERYDLITQLVEERDQCLVTFMWKHQRDILVEQAAKLKMTYAVIDGDTPEKELPRIVDAYQAGKIKVIFAQPQSAAHGLTLTAGTTTIWASPTYDAERFLQLNRRQYRAGQTKKTETIVIAGQDTIDEHIYYNVLSGRVGSLADMLTMMQTNLKAAA